MQLEECQLRIFGILCSLHTPHREMHCEQCMKGGDGCSVPGQRARDDRRHRGGGVRNNIAV